MTDSNIIDRVNVLLKSDKPKIIAGRFKDVSELTEQQIRHFKNAEYMWNLHPNNNEGSYKASTKLDLLFARKGYLLGKRVAELAKKIN